MFLHFSELPSTPSGRLRAPPSRSWPAHSALQMHGGPIQHPEKMKLKTRISDSLYFNRNKSNKHLNTKIKNIFRPD